MRFVTLGFVSLTLAAGACGKKPVTIEPTAAPTSAPLAADVADNPADVAAASADVAVAPADVAAAEVAAMDTAPVPADAAAPDAAAAAGPLALEAKALLERWLAAQNSADYDAYAGLYAPRFTGIKRSGPRERQYALAGWLADRKKMFKSAMKVEAAEVQVMPASGTAIVTFVQTWASGTYQDKGRKQLVLVPNKGGLAIAREEMLASEIQPGDAAPKVVDPSLFTLLVPLDEKEANALIPNVTIDPSWGVGEPQLLQKVGPTIAAQPIDVAKLPDALKALIGKKLATDGGCTGAVDRLLLVTRVSPHFGVIQGWDGTGDGADGKVLSEKEIAAEVFTAQSAELVARIAGCGPGIWARDADKPVLPVYGNNPVDAKLEKKALAAFRKLAGWRAVEVDAKLPESGVTTATWDVFDGAAPVVASWTEPASGRTFVQVTASAGVGCGSFGGSFGALYEVGKDDTFVLLTDPEGGPTIPVEGVVDIDGDGEVEFYRDQVLIQRVGPIWKETLDITPADFDCPC